MAYEGELVKLENGRWARFQHVSVYGASPTDWDGAILVAVELEERFQRMLDDAELSLEEPAAARRLQLRADQEGQYAVTLAEATVH